METQRHRMLGEHIYDGLPFPGVFPAKQIEAIKDIDLTGDVLIASYPKTGTTWMQEMVWLIQSEGDFATAEKKRIGVRAPFLEVTEEHLPTLDEIVESPHPRLLKTHLPVSIYTKQLAELNFMIIIPIRNPKDTLVSFYHFHKMASIFNFNGNWSDFFEIVKSKYMYSGDYFDWYMDWLQYRDHPNVKIVKYEDMKQDLGTMLKEVAAFLGKTLSTDLISRIMEHLSFSRMKDNAMVNYTVYPDMNHQISPFIRKGVVGDWKYYFSADQNKYIDKMYANTLEKIGIKFRFE